MKVHASARFIRQSPFKVRRVLDLVRGLPVVEARNVALPTRSARRWSRPWPTPLTTMRSIPRNYS